VRTCWAALLCWDGQVLNCTCKVRLGNFSMVANRTWEASAWCQPHADADRYSQNVIRIRGAALYRSRKLHAFVLMKCCPRHSDATLLSYFRATQTWEGDSHTHATLDCVQFGAIRYARQPQVLASKKIFQIYSTCAIVGNRTTATRRSPSLELWSRSTRMSRIDVSSCTHTCTSWRVLKKHATVCSQRQRSSHAICHPSVQSAGRRNASLRFPVQRLITRTVDTAGTLPSARSGEKAGECDATNRSDRQSTSDAPLTSRRRRGIKIRSSETPVGQIGRHQNPSLRRVRPTLRLRAGRSGRRGCR
jgi:hypothetical protein